MRETHTDSQHSLPPGVSHNISGQKFSYEAYPFVWNGQTALTCICPLFITSSNLIGEICILEDMTSHLPIIEIRIEECRGMAF